MDLILCHTTADFDAIGAAVGLTKLHPGAKIVLTGGSHPAVKDFLALHRDEYSFIERKSVNSEQIRSLFIVDTQKRDRLGKCSIWLDLPQLISITIYDHHFEQNSDISAHQIYVESVGSTTTLITQLLQEKNIKLTKFEATVMALGIHVDTGSLTFLGTTYKDALALAWLIQQGANIHVISNYIDPGLTPQLQQLMSQAIDNLHKETLLGYTLGLVLIETANFVPGLSSLTARLEDLTELDALLFANIYPVGNESKLTVIGRTRIPNTNLNIIFQSFGGGGHSQAVSLTLKCTNYHEIINQLFSSLKQQIPHPLTAIKLMSSPVRTIRPNITITEAQRILLRYGHSGLSVVNEQDQLVGIISRRDIDLALHHGFSHAPVKGYMTPHLKTITPDTTLPEIESLMVTYDIGRLPVLSDGKLVGIVTRTDVLRQLHQERTENQELRGKNDDFPSCYLPVKNIRDRMKPALKQFLTLTSQLAEQKGWHLYLVGGAVRDLLLAKDEENLMIEDIDLVVDGYAQTAEVGAGMELAKALQDIYHEARLEIHGQFQTAALLWHKHPELGSLWVDIATARTEFYPYPAANPEVEASSIKQDLYRRDFTINALALRLNPGNINYNDIYEHQLLDFFGGVNDIESGIIRVLHPNSFIEDPTRIYRAVRFAVRLNFTIESQTEAYIKYAIASGIYHKIKLKKERAPSLETRLKNELKYILTAHYWIKALKLLDKLGALTCIHSSLELNQQFWWEIRFMSKCLQRIKRNVNISINFPDWQIRLELLIANLKPEYRGKVAENLQFSGESISRLQGLENGENILKENLQLCQYPSEIMKILKQYDLETLILIGARSTKVMRKIIWKYLTYWLQIKPPLNGHDLKIMGYKQGPNFKIMLESLLLAIIDEKIGERKEDAIAFIKQNFPI